MAMFDCTFEDAKLLWRSYSYECGQTLVDAAQCIAAGNWKDGEELLSKGLGQRERANYWSTAMKLLEVPNDSSN